MPPSIPKDSTLSSVWPSLADQRGYLSGVRHKMELCVKAHGNAHVRIGIRGAGVQPCYRIFFKGKDQAEVIYGSYWDIHQPLETEDAVTSNWSTASMDFAELDALFEVKHPEAFASAKRVQLLNAKKQMEQKRN
jgi:hypothetical protein